MRNGSLYRNLGNSALLSLPLVFLVFLDGTAIETVARDENAHWRDLASSVTEISDATYWIALAVGLLAAASVLALIRRDVPVFKNLRQWALHLALALLGSGALIQVLKLCVGRERPSFARSAAHVWNFGFLRTGYLYSSFPSGHSQVIFCVATFLGILLPRWRIPAYLAACALALTRVLVLKHFPSDVAAGMLIGVYGSWWSVRLWSRRFPAPQSLQASRSAEVYGFPTNEDQRAA